LFPTLNHKQKLPQKILSYINAFIFESQTSIVGMSNNNQTTRKLFLLVCLLATQTLAFAQEFTRDDTLRGSITPERVWWDLLFYDLNVQINPDEQSISGHNTIHYKVLNNSKLMQIDLQPPLKVERILQNNQELSFTKDGSNVYLVTIPTTQTIGSTQQLTVYYSGKPRAAKRAPWDGGFSWKKDSEGKHFVATSCQGLGSSVWWPCKDHMYDEPDSMKISVTVPKELTDVSNGRLQKVTDNQDNTRTFEWFVRNPINNYGVNANVANYVHYSDEYEGEKGKLSLNYYVLPQNLEKSKKQFEQVKLMLKAFEHWFGAYPFYEDGFKLVEVPYLGMEHQSSVTYGNGYQNGYLGRDLSGTGWGLKWDFIIIHESGHEWFANNITYKDIADMWIHESFTNYSETLFTEYYHGKEAGNDYVVGTRKLIGNSRPIIGKYNLNHEGSGDMYYKGGNMLHTIRQVIDDDALFREVLRGLNRDFYHQTVETAQIEKYMAQKSNKKLGKIFDQYLRNTSIPTLEYKIEGKNLCYRWTNCIDGFDMPVRISTSETSKQWISPITDWKKQKTKLKTLDSFEIDRNFYVFKKKVEK
jgi:aminopeptidase N